MKKLAVSVLFLFVLSALFFPGCQKSPDSGPSAPTATPTVPTSTPTQVLTATVTQTNTPVNTPTFTATRDVTPLLIDGFEDQDTQNDLGYWWYAYDDSAAGGTSANQGLDFWGSGAVGTWALRSGNNIDTHIPHVPTGNYYGYVGTYTELSGTTDLTQYNGVRFRIQWMSLVPGGTQTNSVGIISSDDASNNRTTHYRKSFTLAAEDVWYTIELPFDQFTQDYTYGTAHPQTLQQVLSTAERISFDQVYIHTTLDFYAWSQYYYIDHVELY